MPNRAITAKSLRTQLARFTASVSHKTPDFQLENHGSLFLLRPLNDAAKNWMDEHLPVANPETQFWGDSIIIEPRYVAPVVDGILADGLALR
jgi:hypothetical protein